MMSLRRPPRSWSSSSVARIRVPLYGQEAIRACALIFMVELVRVTAPAWFVAVARHE